MNFYLTSFFFFFFNIVSIEPVGSKAPSILGEKGSLMERRAKTDIVILCQGQSYPVPTFR